MSRREEGVAWWQRGWVVAAAVIAGGTLIGLAVPVAFRSDPKGPPTAARTTVQVGQLVSAPQVSLDDVAWRDFHGVVLPYSAQDGPRELDGADQNLARGFARTPRGALLAAIHITVRASMQWGPEVFDPTIDQQVIGPDADALLAATRETYERHRGDRRDGAALGRGYVVLEGFRWQGYSPVAASVDLVSAGPGDSDVTVRAATRIQVHWHNNDWRVVAPPGGTWAGAAAPVDSPDGYVRFPSGGG
ncbi:hypothetical protein [Actinomadura sp. 7K507]|uniref:hypothetical protein n=1 Tax=Actinomadura sp. 7K507 TaxID=2530365 RepID=UPI001049CC79|nr:hypothetical protein [Actinomadura sp. 7K507]TDC77439.1 hypothetical protein E1285_38685 [Actinomadura sp. 7K507]